jgi:hypothetical protein
MAGPVDDLIAPHKPAAHGAPSHDAKHKLPTTTWVSSGHEKPSATESSAWIPAVRPKRDEG